MEKLFQSYISSGTWKKMVVIGNIHGIIIHF